MALTVRQVGQVSPPLKQAIDQFQLSIDNNDQIVARLREQLRRLEPQREKLTTSVKQRQDDRRNLHSSLARLEDSLASFGKESALLTAAIEEIPRILERLSLHPSQHGMLTPGANAFATVPFAAGRLVPAATIDVPLPFFETLAQHFAERLQQICERVNAVDDALSSYSRQRSGVPVAVQIEAVVRSEHAQFRALAAQVAQLAEHLEQLREAAIRTRGVPAGMLARPFENGMVVDQQMLMNHLMNNKGGMLLGGSSGVPQHAQFGPTIGGGSFGQPGVGVLGLNMVGQNTIGGLYGAPAAGGGLFGQVTPGSVFGQSSSGSLLGQQSGGLFGPNIGGGLFSQNTGGGLFSQNTGGGLFSQNTGGGVFGANTGGGMFGQSGGSGLFGQSMGGGLLGQSSGGGMFGQSSAGGSLFGQGTGGGGLFGQNTGGGMFGQASGGGLFGGQNAGGMFGANTAGALGQNMGSGLFGQNTGAGLFGQNSGGGLFGGQNTGGGLFGGAAQTSGGLFGGAAQNSGGGLFGGAAQSSGGLFGASTGGGLF